MVIAALVGRRVGAWYRAWVSDKTSYIHRPTIRLWHCLCTSVKQWHPASRPEHCPEIQRTLRPTDKTEGWSIYSQTHRMGAFQFIGRDDASRGIFISIKNACSPDMQPAAAALHDVNTHHPSPSGCRSRATQRCVFRLFGSTAIQQYE